MRGTTKIGEGEVCDKGGVKKGKSFRQSRELEVKVRIHLIFRIRTVNPFPISTLYPRDTIYREEEQLTISKATSQLSLTTLGTSILFAYSCKIGKHSSVAIPPNASAASCLTISSSFSLVKTSIKEGTESGELNCPKTNAISCL